MKEYSELAITKDGILVFKSYSFMKIVAGIKEFHGQLTIMCYVDTIPYD